MPSLPEGYFFRVTDLFGAPLLELRQKSWPFSRRINTIWILETNDEHLVEQAEYLKKLLIEGSDSQKFLAKREGDYPPRTLD